MKNLDINIYRGILTGYNEAFIIDEKTKYELIEELHKNAEIISSILRGRDIKDMEMNWEIYGLHILAFSPTSKPMDI